jgi:hypothetical protein
VYLRFIALDIYEDVDFRHPTSELGDSVRSATSLRIGHFGSAAKTADRRGDVVMVRGDDHAAGRRGS